MEIVLIVYLGYLITKEFKFNKPLKEELQIYKTYLERKLKENQSLKAKIEYLNDPENFKKELKEKFNLVEPQEKVIILPDNFKF